MGRAERYAEDEEPYRPYRAYFHHWNFPMRRFAEAGGDFDPQPEEARPTSKNSSAPGTLGTAASDNAFVLEGSTTANETTVRSRLVRSGRRASKMTRASFRLSMNLLGRTSFS